MFSRGHQRLWRGDDQDVVGLQVAVNDQVVMHDEREFGSFANAPSRAGARCAGLISLRDQILLKE